MLNFSIFIDYCFLADVFLLLGYFFGLPFDYVLFAAYSANFFFIFINIITPITTPTKPPAIPAINPIIHDLNYSYV